MKRALLILSMFAASSPLPGQEDPDRAPKVEFRVTRFDPADRPSPTFRVAAAGGKVDVEVPLTHIGGPHQATLRDGVFLDLWRGEAEKPEISLKIEATEHKDLLLVFFPVKDSFQVLKVSTPLARLRGGDRHLINTTGSELAIKLGDDPPVMIASGKSGLVRGPGGNKAVSLPVLISLRDGEKWNLASTEQWPCDPRFRRYLFAYMSPHTRQLAFHVVSERLQQSP